MSDVTSAPPLYKRLEALSMQFAERAWETRDQPNSAYLQDHAYSLSEFAQQAERECLMDGDSLTQGQQLRVARLLASGHIAKLQFHYRPFDLPDGWLAVEVFYQDGHSIYGGISPEGDMHT